MVDRGLEEITAGVAVIKPTTMAALQELRNAGLREATLGQITAENRGQLAWVEYRDGSRRINIWTRVSSK